MNDNPSMDRALWAGSPKPDYNFTTDFASLQRRQPHLYHLAVREAEALALQTPFPHLVLPDLLEEKLKLAAQWADRQRSLKHGDSESAFAA